MASTLGVLPRVESPVEFEELAKLVVRKCDATVVRLQGLNEVETYIDTRTRVIMIDFPELPPIGANGDASERINALKEADEALRKTIRKLPATQHTVSYSTWDSRVVDKYDERRLTGL